eukprot:365650-Chlamydomonas_euryale.AAC.17
MSLPTLKAVSPPRDPQDVPLTTPSGRCIGALQRLPRHSEGASEGAQRRHVHMHGFGRALAPRHDTCMDLGSLEGLWPLEGAPWPRMLPQYGLPAKPARGRVRCEEEGRAENGRKG